MDLSKVLGDVYAGHAAPTPHAAPDWADEAHLDEAFANWTPGPPADAPAAEREMAAHVEVTSRRRIDDDLAAALSEALSSGPATTESVYAELVQEIPEAFVEPEPEPQPTLPHTWRRGDDDVLPSRSGGRKPRFSLLSR
jgi:hypothetical protein